MRSVCTVNMRVTDTNIKISSVAEQCFYGKFMSPATWKYPYIITSLYTVAEIFVRL